MAFYPRHLARVAAAAFVAATLLAMPAAAQQGEGAQQVDLNPQTVERFLDSYGELDGLRADFEREYGRAAVDPQDPTAAFLAYARNDEARRRIDEVVQRHDLDSLERWADVAYSVMIAYSFSEQSDDGLTLDEEMDETVREIENDGSISAEQKAQMIEMLERQREALAALRPTPENVAAVEPYLERIREAIDP